VANKSTSQDFQIGHPKFGGRKKGFKKTSPTIWMLEALKKRGYDFEKELVNALKMKDYELLDRLIKIAPHIANRPKETVGMEGIENLVIKEFIEDAPANGAK
jgi:hypothetical protein